MTAAAQPMPSPSTGRMPDLKAIANQFPQWIKKNLPQTIISSVVAGVVGYVSNVWLMAVKYEGNQTPKGSPVTAKGNFFQGGLFWALLSSVLMGVVSYRRSVGKERFWSDVRSLPTVIANLVRAEGKAGRIHLLWGAATAMVASIFVSPALGAVLALGFLVSAPSVIGSILSSLLFRVWSTVVRKVAPTKASPTTGMTSMTVGLLGGAAALAVSFLVTGSTVKLVLAVGCAGARWCWRPGRPPAIVAVLLLLIAVGVVLADLLTAHRAFADDGGFAECGSKWNQWWTNCAGAGAVRRQALGGGAAASGGAILGGFAGNLAGNGGWGGGGGPGDDHGPITEQGRDHGAADRNAILGWIRQLLADPRSSSGAASIPNGPATRAMPNSRPTCGGATNTAWPIPGLVLPSQRPPRVSVAAPAADGQPGDDYQPGGQPDPGDRPLGQMDPADAVAAGGGGPRPAGFDPFGKDPFGDDLFGGDDPFGDDGWDDIAGTTAKGPQLPSADDVRGRLRQIDWETPDFNSPIHAGIEQIRTAIAANGGTITPEIANAINQLEGGSAANLQNELNAINERLAKHSNEGMDYIDDQNAKALALEAAQRAVNERIAARERYIWNHIDDLPGKDSIAIREVLGQIEAGSANTEMLGRLHEVSNHIFGERQGEFAAEHGKAAQDARDWNKWMERAQTVQKVAIAAELALAPFAVPLTAGGAAGVATFNLGRNVVEGAAVAWSEGKSPAGILAEVARRTLPVNTLEASYRAWDQAMHGKTQDGPGVGGIALGFFQDVGNALTLHAGIGGIKNLQMPQAPLEVDTSAMRKLNGDVPPRVPSNEVDAKWLQGQREGSKLAQEFKDLNDEVKTLRAAGNHEAANRAERVVGEGERHQQQLSGEEHPEGRGSRTSGRLQRRHRARLEEGAGRCR